MIKEFFSSIVRTLGRIVAYILIAFLFFLLFNQVKADTIDTTYSYIQSIKEDWSIGISVNSDSASDYTNITRGFQWTPINSSNNAIPLNESEYYVSLDFVIAYGSTLVTPVLQDILNNLTIQVSTSYINATCDGYEDLQITQSYVANSQLYNRYEYVCDSLIVNQDFNRVRIRSVVNSMPSNGIHPVQLFIFETKFLDVNDLNPGFEYIGDKMDDLINNQNQNTQSIINNQNSNTNIINSTITQTNSFLTDSTPADTTIISNIQNLIPVPTPVTDLLTLPIQILNKEISTLNSGTCSGWAINFGSYFDDYTLLIPCINMSNVLYSSWSWGGYTLWQIIDIIFSMYMAYNILCLILSAYYRFSHLEDATSILYRFNEREAKERYYGG